MDRIFAAHKIKLHIVLPILAVLSVLLFLYIYDIQNQQTKHLNARFQQSIQSTGKLFDSLLAERASLLSAEISHLQTHDELAVLFIARDRDNLYTYSRDIFEYMRREHNITHFYFHGVDGRNFLRVHQKNRFGDEITRETMREAMRLGRVVNGVEIGPLGTLTLRSVSPWWVDGELVGYLELGIEVSAIVRDMAKETEGQLYTLVWKDGIGRAEWERGMAMLERKAQWGLLSNAVISFYSGADEQSKYTGLLEKVATNEREVTSLQNDDGLFFAGRLPLVDMTGKQRGLIVLMKDMSMDMLSADKAIQRLTATSSGLGVILIMLFYVMTERLEKRLGISQQRVSAEVQARLSMQAKHIEELEYLNLYDSLTGLPNRQLLLEYVKQEMRASDRRQGAFALVLLDIKRLKEINNTLGHVRGDALLACVGARLKELLRESDVVARVEGDEFAILLPSVTRDYVIRMAEKIRDFFAKPFMLDDLSIDIDVVLGVAVYPEHGDNEGMLLQRADIAVRQAKDIDKPYYFYDADHDQYSFERIELFGDLRRAVGVDNELKVYYQPKVQVSTGRVVGAEALVRWVHPTRGLISPGEFIPLAEHTGLISSITDRVLSEVARDAASCGDVYRELCISVNLSVQNLLDDKLPDRLIELLENPDLQGCDFILEITETSIMRDLGRSKRIMQKLHGMGFKFSIDDFGTGYSSLSYLSQLPVTELKIDQSFVRNMLKSRSDSAIVKSTIDLAHGLGLGVCAEGIEEVEVLNRLREWGCDLAQGYLISRPLPQYEFLRWLDEEYPQSFLCMA